MQVERTGSLMNRQNILFLLAGVLLAYAWISSRPVDQAEQEIAAVARYVETDSGAWPGLPPADLSGRAVLDITVHTEEALEILLERAEKIALSPDSNREESSIVLVLHGPEVEFFSTKNYDRYKAIVDKAARLDAFDIVDVKICQTMMSMHGIERDDIPAFIEQVSLGSAEIDRLEVEGYLRF